MGPFHPKSHLSCLIPPSSFSPDIFSPVSVPPSLKVCLDLSAEYLILSDVQRKVGCSGSRVGSTGGDEGVCGSSGVFLAPELSCDLAACAGPLRDGTAAEPGGGPGLLQLNL